MGVRVLRKRSCTSCNSEAGAADAVVTSSLSQLLLSAESLQSSEDDVLLEGRWLHQHGLSDWTRANRSKLLRVTSVVC